MADIIDLDEYRAKKERLRKEKEDEPETPGVTIRRWPGLSLTSIGPLQGMGPNPCVAPYWVATYGLSQLEARLCATGIPPAQREPYIEYFEGIWERRDPVPAEGCDPKILRQVELFSDELRQVKRQIFGE